jgi:predicted dehydrogenase
MDPLRTGIIGVGGYGALVLKELARNSAFQLQAVADRNPELAEEFARQHDAAAYDDYRSLIVEKKLDVIFLMLPPFLCAECLQLAARAGVHVFKGAPLARKVPEAIQWIQWMAQGGGVFHVASSRRFAPSYVQAHRWLEQGRIGQPYFIEAEMFYPHQGGFDWRGDPILAGGGALLESGCHLIDQILWGCGLPEQVYCLHSNFCRKKALPPYQTEDTAAVLMKYPDGLVASVSCGWMSAPNRERMVWHGVEGRIEASPEEARLYDPQGRIVDQTGQSPDEGELIARQIQHFAESLRDSEIKPLTLARDRVADVSVIETAYLSAKTRLPEKIKVYDAMLKNKS